MAFRAPLFCMCLHAPALAEGAHPHSHLPIAGSFKVATDIVDLGFRDIVVDLRLWRPPR